MADDKSPDFELVRIDNNPWISPRIGCEWEARGTFNPAAIEAYGSIHILYRAIDSKGVSRLGYARSEDGINISYRSENPVVEPSSEFEEFGCEDPRLTIVNGKVYFTYTSYSHIGTRISLGSTSNFETFEKHGIIGPDCDDKDCVLFPEKINNKMVMFHRIKPNIQIAYFDSFEQLKSKSYWAEYMKNLEDRVAIRPEFQWDKNYVGSGTPPIKTPSGWLMLYHGVDEKMVYRAGALLLDLKDPRKVLGRTPLPILAPEKDYESTGVVPNVVFPTGAVLRSNLLLVYYGGADKTCCVATGQADKLISSMLL